MKSLSKIVMLNLLCFTIFNAQADDATNAYNNQQTSTNTQKLVEYLQNLGNYFGFDVTTNPTQNNPEYTISYKIINLTASQLAQAYQFYTFLGSIPVNTFANSTGGGGGGQTGNSGNPFAQFVPESITGASALNALANNVFQNFNSAGAANSEQVTVSKLIDQQTFQTDPVSQAVLNILGTPDYTYCMDYDKAQTFDPNCSFLYSTLVPLNVVGKIPNATDFFNTNYIQTFLNQLNSNALTAPLMYSNQSLGSTQPPNTQGGGNNTNNQGLTAQNQEQLAANFIRYVTGGVVPIKLPRWKDYDQLYTQSVTKPTSGSGPSTQQMQAEQTLAKYLASLRTYAAQNSVGVSNLYYIMSKRMPQTAPSQQNSGQMSQALTEFNMATWRLYNPAQTNTNNAGALGGVGSTGATGQPGNTPWINSLNNAPPATVEKEIAILLAEINYQLYLDRQIHERLLMTNSILLLQSVRTGAPSTDFLAGQQSQ